MVMESLTRSMIRLSFRNSETFWEEKLKKWLLDLHLLQLRFLTFWRFASAVRFLRHMEWLRLLVELVFNILKEILQAMLEVHFSVTSFASEISPRWIIIALMKFPKVKSVFGDQTSLPDISKTRRKPMKPSSTGGSIVVMSARSIRMEELPSSTELRISSSCHRVSISLQKSLKMCTYSHRSWPSAGSMEIHWETMLSDSLSLMKCIWKSIVPRTNANSTMNSWKMKHWEW